MGFETPQPPLSEYLAWTTSGHLQLPDFQREYKWEDERIRSLLATVLRGHPMGAVMILETGSNQIRFKPRPVTGTAPRRKDLNRPGFRSYREPCPAGAGWPDSWLA